MGNINQGKNMYPKKGETRVTNYYATYSSHYSINLFPLINALTVWTKERRKVCLVREISKAQKRNSEQRKELLAEGHYLVLYGLGASLHSHDPVQKAARIPVRLRTAFSGTSGPVRFPIAGPPRSSKVHKKKKKRRLMIRRDVDWIKRTKKKFKLDPGEPQKNWHSLKKLGKNCSSDVNLKKQWGVLSTSFTKYQRCAFTKYIQFQYVLRVKNPKPCLESLNHSLPPYHYISWYVSSSLKFLKPI